MVRLKAVIDAQGNKWRVRFNSTMVRLKVDRPDKLKYLDKQFQFHNGSIKSRVIMTTAS